MSFDVSKLAGALSEDLPEMLIVKKLQEHLQKYGTSRDFHFVDETGRKFRVEFIAE